MIVTEGNITDGAKGLAKKVASGIAAGGTKAKGGVTSAGKSVKEAPGKTVGKMNKANAEILNAITGARKRALVKGATNAANKGKDSRSTKLINKANAIKHADETGKGAKIMTAAEIATVLAGLAYLGLVVKKMLKDDPNSAVLKEAQKRVKALEKEAKDAQKEVKKAKTPAEAKAAQKKVNAAQKKINKLRTQIGRLADKNLAPAEVEKIKKRLEKMIAESVASAYTEAELMMIEMSAFTESLMYDHFACLEYAADMEEAEMDDIFGEDYDDADMAEIDDIFGEDVDEEEDFEESFEDLEDGPEFDESVFEDFDLDW